MENAKRIDKNETAVSDSTQPLTPEQLVQRHMEHPDEPITDKDMQNLQSGVQNATSPNGVALTDEQKAEAAELAKAIESDGTGMSYDASL